MSRRDKELYGCSSWRGNDEGLSREKGWTDVIKEKWGKKKLRGSIYDLSHLDSFILDVVPGDATAPTLKVAVSFDMHTFTRKREDTDTPDLHFGQNGNPRSFCVVRYACSLYLPTILKKASRGNVYFSHKGNFLIVDHIPAVPKEYAVVFTLVKSRLRGVNASMFVISAHERRNPLATMEGISLYTLVRNISNDLPPRGRRKAK